MKEEAPLVLRYYRREDNEAWKADVPDLGMKDVPIGGPRREEAEQTSEEILNGQIRDRCNAIIQGTAGVVTGFEARIAIQCSSRGYVLQHDVSASVHAA